MFARFFMLKQYSTAEKIIALVEKKIIRELQSKRIIKKETDALNPIDPYLDDKYKLAQALGDALRSEIVDVLYAKYQNLSDDKKNQFRKNIVDGYFEFLLSTHLNNIEIIYSNKAVDNGHIYPSSTVTQAKIILPNEFFQKSILVKEMCCTFSSVRDELIQAGEDIFNHTMVL